MATMYATPLAGAPADVYRQVDVASRVVGASPHRLVSLMFEDLEAALRQAAFATEHRRFEAKSARVTKALAILFALEAALDHRAGGDLAQTLSRVYRGARGEITNASVTGDAAKLRDVAHGIAEIGGAWRQING